MCYWVVYSGYSICEATVGRYLLFWLPFYDVLRLLTVLWLVAPFTRGAQLLYKHFVHPELSKYENQIDAVCATYSDALHQGAAGLVRFAARSVFQWFVRLNTLVFQYVQSRSLAEQQQRSALQYGVIPQVTYVTGQSVFGQRPVLEAADLQDDPVLVSQPLLADRMHYVHAEQLRRTDSSARSSSSDFADGLEFDQSPQLHRSAIGRPDVTYDPGVHEDAKASRPGPAPAPAAHWSPQLRSSPASRSPALSRPISTKAPLSTSPLASPSTTPSSLQRRTSSNVPNKSN